LDGNHVFALHVSRPSTFRAPGWGALTSLSSCCRWRNATSRKLVPFSHRSASRIFIRQPSCIPSPVVTQNGDHQFDGGDKRAGLRPLPRPQLQGSSSSWMGQRVRRARALPPAARAVVMPCAPEDRPRRRALLGRRSCSWAVLPLLRYGASARRSVFARPGGSEWGSAGGQMASVVGAEVVAAEEVLVADGITATIRAPGLRLFGFDSFSSPLEWGRGRGPCCSSVCPEAIAAAVWPPGAEVVVAAAGAGGGEPPGVLSSRRPSNVGGCS
jgi:hypothetical protein